MSHSRWPSPPLSFGSERCTELPPGEKADHLASADSARHAAQETADGFQTRTPGQGWTTGYLKASNVGGNDYFGGAVAISGSTIAVSAINEASSATGVNSGMGMDDSAFQAGAVYVFEETLGSWQETAYIKASNAEDRDAFGVSVAIDGETILVGARGESSVGVGVNSNEQSDNSLSNSGALYQFTKGMSGWEQRAYVKASNPDEFDRFGSRVALDGS